MRASTVMSAIAVTAVAGAIVARSALQTPAVRQVDEKVLREYTGVYQWKPDGFLYLQIWNEFTGTNQLTAFDESGELRTLYPTDPDRFFAGPGAAVASAIEARVEFQRDNTGRIASLTWQRESAPSRVAQRVGIERHEDVRFSNGDVQLAGTLVSPIAAGKHPAIILVHDLGRPADSPARALARRFDGSRRARGDGDQRFVGG